MTDLSGFISEGIRAVRDTLDTEAARANLHLHPETLTRTAARRLKRTLAVLETVLRRLLVLLLRESSLRRPRRVRPAQTRPPGHRRLHIAWRDAPALS